MALTIKRPERWDQPFGVMTEADLDRLLDTAPLSHIHSGAFPATASLRGILRNDTRIQRYRPGDVVMRQGDYGSSAFLVLSGHVRVVLGAGLAGALLGRLQPRRKGLLGALAQVWRNHRIPEVRNPARYTRTAVSTRRSEDEIRVFLQDFPRVLESHGTVRIGPEEIFGEIAALGRTPRTATVFADSEAELLEIRWQGLRDLRRRAKPLRDHIDALYRERSLQVHLRETPQLRHLEYAQIKRLAAATLFESYGELDWYGSYKSLAAQSPEQRLEREPIIAEEGHYADGLILIRSGFARVSMRVNHGHRTLCYLTRGDSFGLDELAHNWRTGETVPLQHTLRALGYVDVLRVPTAVVEELVLPELPPSAQPPALRARKDTRTSEPPVGKRPDLDPDLLEQLVEGRYINGTAAMLIDLQRCVGCDDCVRACAAAHDNNPRFIRHGPRLGRYMVANACMHCQDPVCMIGCPTGAIHRHPLGGQVIINDDTCIGCATCANSCPYDNIRMVEIRAHDGAVILDQQTHAPILKATKCDLCVEQLVTPACERACPHDAMKRLDMCDFPTLTRWLDR